MPQTIEGFGAGATGGAGGTVINVTNLNNSGAGSYREALLSQVGPRIVRFTVSGTITLTSHIELKNGENGSGGSDPGKVYDDLTIDGSTAPNQGVQIAGNTTVIRCDNVIIQYMRFRSDELGGTSIGSFLLQGATNTAVNHCTVQWGDDGDLDIVGTSSNCTVQWCVLGPNFGSGTMLLNANGGITLHHNLFYVGVGSRGPAMGGGPLDCDFVNNVIYRNRPPSLGPFEYHELTLLIADNGSVAANVDRNYYAAGGAENVTLGGRPVSLYGDRAFSATSSAWISGNRVPAYAEPTAQDKVYFHQNGTAFTVAGSRFSFPAVTATSAAQAYTDVMATAGARLPCLDARDSELLAHVAAGTGGNTNTWTNSSDLGGYPDLTVPCPSSGIFRGGKFHMRVL